MDEDTKSKFDTKEYYETAESREIVRTIRRILVLYKISRAFFIFGLLTAFPAVTGIIDAQFRALIGFTPVSVTLFYYAASCREEYKELVEQLTAKLTPARVRIAGEDDSKPSCK